jgi:SAM-dependent methyltransferase
MQYVTADQLREAANASFEDGTFVEDLHATNGVVPDHARYREFERLIHPGPLLEIGPGGGHFLAAARERGHEIAGIELSAANRAFILKHFGIALADEPIEQDRLPANYFQTVVSFNCIEHVLDPVEEMIAVRRVLAPGGIFIFTTSNAASLLARLPRGYWVMFKPPDHVSIGSAESFTRAANRAGLQVGEIFYSEYPLETPLGVVSAIRDAWRERTRVDDASNDAARPPHVAPPLSPWASWLRIRLNRWQPTWSPATLTSRYGLSSTIGVQLQKPPT